MANNTLTLTQIVNGIKDNSFKFERLKSDLERLAGLLDGAVIVKPQDTDNYYMLMNMIENDKIIEPRKVDRPAFISIDMDMIKGLVNQIRETV